MKQKKTHPAIESASLKARQRYLIFAASLVVCVLIFAVGFIFKPRSTKSIDAVDFKESTPVNTYVKADIVLSSAMFEQDETDEDGNVIGTVYYAIAVDSDDNKFMIRVPKDYYEENISPIESNTTVDIESGSLEILDNQNKITLYGYVRDMSNNLKEVLSSTDNEYNKAIISVVYNNLFDVVTEQATAESFNPLYIAAGFVGIISLIILMTAVSASANLSRLKEKHAEETVTLKKKKKKK